MIIYNVTTKVDPTIAESWLSWLKEEHIPDIKATGCFNNAVVCHLLEIEEQDGITYAVQFHAPDMDSYNRYIVEFSATMRTKAIAKWNNKAISFRSLLEVVH